jgi:hypothetical protein
MLNKKQKIKEIKQLSKISEMKEINSILRQFRQWDIDCFKLKIENEKLVINFKDQFSTDGKSGANFLYCIQFLFANDEKDIVAEVYNLFAYVAIINTKLEVK